MQTPDPVTIHLQSSKDLDPSAVLGPRLDTGKHLKWWMLAAVLTLLAGGATAAGRYWQPREAPQATRIGQITPQAANEFAPLPANEGPYAYRFQPGETLNYRLEAYAGGMGIDPEAQGAVGLNMRFDMRLDTERVSPSGAGQLQLAFTDVIMTGRFMGEPVELYKNGVNTRMDLGAGQALDTAHRDSTAGIPQLAFFEDPIHMTVAPDGTVTKLSGQPGLADMVQTARVLSPVQFPASELAIGHQWISAFNLPVPGLAMPAAYQCVNTFLGYQMIDGVHCGVIQQELLSSEENGALHAPEGRLGEAMGFSMPRFNLSGTNTIYFDVTRQHLQQADMNLHLDLEIGKELEPVARILGAYSQLLDDLEYGARSHAKQEATPPLLDLGLDINARLALMP